MKKVSRKKCRNCGEKFVPNKSTQVACSYPCALNLGRKKVSEDKFKELKEKVEDYSAKLQTKVQEIARLIDYEQNCLAKNKPMSKKIDGGHVFSRGSSTNIKYNLHNIFAQSAQSNHFQSDDRLMHEGVKREFGDKYYEFLCSLNQTPIVKYTNQDYKDFYKRACAVANRLKKNKKRLTSKQRIEVRNEVNTELGIYPKEYLIFDI